MNSKERLFMRLSYLSLALAMLLLGGLGTASWLLSPTIAEAESQVGELGDTTPPVVEEFVIADGAQTTSELAVTLDVTAHDPEAPSGSSGIQAIEFLQFEYIFAANRWVPIERSGWVDYATAHENYPWTLLSTYGVRYMQAWGVDLAGNISREPGIDIINLLPSQQVASVAEDQVDFYRIYVEAGQTLSSTLMPVDGDADLYIWGASDEPWYSNSPTEVERVQFEAPETGTYQIEVHGYTDAQYRLLFEATDAPASAFRGFRSASKPVPSAPTVPLDDLPEPSPPTSTPTPIPTLTPTVTATPTGSWWADLEITQSDMPEPVDVGLSLTYTITVTNLGPNKATGVSLFDQLPEDVEFVSVTLSQEQATCAEPDDETFVCNLDEIPNGESVTVTLVVKPTANGLIYNTANVSSANDNNSSNNYSVEESTVEALLITKVNLDYGLNDAATQLYIEGFGFESPLTVSLGTIELDVTSMTSQLIGAVVPAGLEPGWYDLTVETLFGEDTLLDAFHVLDPNEVELDLTPPTVNDFVIADGAETTTEITVTLDMTATDPDTPDADASGVSDIQFIEFIYLFDAQRWVPVQSSGWLPYITAHENYPWTLTTTYGLRYIQAWAVDKAGNISQEPGIDVINLVPEEQVGSLAEGEVDFYRILVNVGQTLTATLTPLTGDPNLSICALDGVLVSSSSNPTGVDSVTFEAPETRTYQIEVHANTAAEYRLSFGTSDASAGGWREFESSSKPVPTYPRVRLDNTSGNNFCDNLSATYTIYLPMTIR